MKDKKLTTKNSNFQKVKNHFEKWPFPDIDFHSREGLLLLKCLHKWIIAENQNDRTSNPPKVIDLGCGTGHSTIAMAKNFPTVQFWGIDISEKSLEVARSFAIKSNVRNITFENCNITKNLTKFSEFRVVLCLGVLHHIEDLTKVFNQIVRLVERNGYLVLWLYGRYGRMKHHLNQSFLKLLTKNMPESKISLISQSFLKDLGQPFAINSGFYTPKGSNEQGINWLLKHPQWLADQMFPAYEKSVTMSDILQLFEANHLEFIQWLGIPCQLNYYTSSKLLLKCFDKLSTNEQLLAIDYLHKPEYYFVVGKKNRK